MTDGQGSILDKIITTQQFSRKEHFRPQEILAEILKALSKREAQVLVRRFGLPDKDKETLESVGKSFNITRERVRQVEKLVVGKIKKAPKLQQVLQPLKEVIMETIEAEGGAVTEKRLLQLLAEGAGQDMPRHTMRFFLSELLNDVVSPIGYNDNDFNEGWLLHNASLEALRKILQSAFTILEQAGKPLSDEALVKKMLEVGAVTPLNEPADNQKVLLALLETGKVIKRNPYGEWGLASWDTITPKRMGDKIYLVLKKADKPLHFRQITQLINDQQFDHKQAHAPTVHNELILDKRYVLVGRGIYALREWGFEPGVVAEVLAKILQEAGGPLTREDLLQRLQKQRMVQPGTVYLALTNKQLFSRTADGKYQLATAN